MPIPPDNRSAGDGGHIGDHNNIADELTSLSAAIAGFTPRVYTQPFTAASLVTVTHNLGKYPSVTVLDSAGDQCEGDVDQLSASQLTVTFSAPFSGTVYCN